MKFPPLAVAAASGILLARAATALDCPATGESAPVILDSSGGVSLGIVSDADAVCTLILVTTDEAGTETFTPFGRSYSSNDWEGVSPTNQGFDCSAPTCSATLPAPAPNQEYRLVSYAHSATSKEQAARFLIQSTFGPALGDIEDYITNHGSSPASFLDAQMSLPATHHRAFFRENNQARTHAAYTVGRTRRPCEAGSRWRNFALSWEDKDFPISVDNTTAPYTFRVQGKPRTQYMELPQPFFPGYSGRLCGRPGQSLGGRSMATRQGGGCEVFYTPRVQFFDDPRVVFANEDDGPILLDLPGPTEMRGDQKMVHVDSIPEDAAGSCAAAPYEGGKTDIFGKDSEGVWWLHDPMLVLRENTPLSPLEDGGKSSAPMPPSLCASAPLTYQNEEYCFFSPNSCAGRGIVCPGDVTEVANDPLSQKEFDFIRDTPTDTNNNAHIDFEYQKIRSWMNVVLHADDQLRQRVAWAFSQILVATASAENWLDGRTERYLNFYDIFVKHAFGNYRDMLKDIAFSPIMATSLTFLDNKSADQVRKETGAHTLPDENFAREIMELFTIGLWKLNADGTTQLDEEGEPIATYDDEDIREMARVWTGFSRQNPRGNIEGDFRNGQMTQNWQDPMRIYSHIRDSFPKRKLDGGYVGDGLPLCTDLPDKPWLRQGATWRLLGTSFHPSMFNQDPGWRKDGDLFVELDAAEPLSTILCGESGSLRGRRAQDCTYPLKVSLSSNLPLDTSATSRMDSIRVVKVNNIYYEYVQTPCVDLPFYNNGKTVKWERTRIMCADPDSMHGTACCTSSTLSNTTRSRPFMCLYPGERVKYSTHEARCDASSLFSCPDYSDINGNYCLENKCCAVYFWHWTSSACDVQVKVTEEGQVGILHVPDEKVSGVVEISYNATARNYFHVDFWEGGDYPHYSNDCGNGECSLNTDGTCTCSTSTENEPVFGIEYFTPEPPADLTNLRDIAENFKIGAIDPTIFDASVYEPLTVWSVSGVTVQAWKHHLNAPQDIVVAVTENGTTKFYKNMISTVRVGESYKFRNAPKFRSDLSSSLYETDLVLDSLFYHQNTAPFISSRLLERFGVSNPSPGYVGRVASAFTTGHYTSGGIDFGTGEYGDLAATVAAVLLDQEARTAAIEVDPTSGALREPLLRVVHLLRSLEYEGGEEFRNMDRQIGQFAYAYPSVFSFFLQDYSPPGRVLSAGLVAPEAFQFDTPQVVGLMKGLFSLVKYGMTKCYDGFGNWGGDCVSIPEGAYTSSSGQLTYLPTNPTDEGIIEEVDLLLTGGRLSDSAKAIIAGALADGQETTSDQKARLVEQLVLASPEYHASGQVQLDESKSRFESQDNAREPEDYKAIVYVFMAGGADTYNLLVPLTDCTARNGTDLYAEYATARSTVALPQSSLLPIKTSSDQPCSTFGVHPAFSHLHELYQDGDATFFANTGFLTRPSDRTNCRANHKGFPIFSHTLQGTAMRVNPQGDLYNTGVLGRMMDVLAPRGYLTASATTGRGGASSSGLATTNDPRKSPRVSHLSSHLQPTPFDLSPSVTQMPSLIKGLNNATALSSSIYGDTWSSAFMDSLEDNQRMFELLHQVYADTIFPSSSIGSNLEVVARMIKARGTRKVERDAFAVVFGNFDSHGSMPDAINNLYGSFNSALASFTMEMKSQQIWERVVLVAMSEFGRSLSPNSNLGTDHGWGGNYFAVGGSIAGGKIHGSYPDDLTFGNPQIMGRGIIPTMSFEGMFNGIASWFGVEKQELDSVLPNRAQSSHLLTEEDIFRHVTNPPTPSPSGAPSSVPTPGIPDPDRYEYFEKELTFKGVRSRGWGTIGGLRVGHDSRVSITGGMDGADHLMKMRITGQDFDGGGDPDDSLSFNMRVKGKVDVDIPAFCVGIPFCSSARGGRDSGVYANGLGWGVVGGKKGLVDYKEALVFTIEDIILTTSERGEFQAHFDGFDRIWLTGGKYIFGEGTCDPADPSTCVEGRFNGTHSVQVLATPMNPFQVTTAASRERNREVGGIFTISGYRDLCKEQGHSCASDGDCCEGTCHNSGYCGDNIFMARTRWSDVINLALGQPATQSSTAARGVASRAVDGNTSGVWSHWSTTHTSGRNPLNWWRVDLRRQGMVGNAEIQKIKVYNRSDCCTNRLDYVKIRILDSSNAVVWEEQIAKPATNEHTFEFDIPVEGVTVEALKDDPAMDDSVISLAEVEVTGRYQYM